MIGLAPSRGEERPAPLTLPITSTLRCSGSPPGGRDAYPPNYLHQLTAMRGGLTAEEYRWKLIRELLD